MATIRHINEEEYAAKALELLNHRREGYVNYALSLLKQSMSPGQASEKLEDKVKDEMETVLFEYLKHRGIVCGELRYLYNINGYCRRIRRTPYKHEVPSNLLDIVISVYKPLRTAGIWRPLLFLRGLSVLETWPSLDVATSSASSFPRRLKPSAGRPSATARS